MNKKFNKFFIANMKRTAQMLAPQIKRKETLRSKIAEMQSELESIDMQMEALNTPIRKETGGYSIEDLMVREIITTVDKNGNEQKSSKWVLKYPETVIPVEEMAGEQPAAESVEWGDNMDTEDTCGTETENTVETNVEEA